MKTINIAEILFPDLSFREQARGLRRFVDENYAGEELTIDFSGVRFSSRAFMDEFYNLFLSPSISPEKRGEVANLSEDLSKMLSAVTRTNTSPRRTIAVEDTPVKSFMIDESSAVGIFWYNAETHSLFGVRKESVSLERMEDAARDGYPFIIYPETNEEVWQQEKFSGDYARTPRGRVSWIVNKFVVLVGSWARPIQGELTALLQSEFSLPSLDLVFDRHWDVAQDTVLDHND